jgi:hypothetical protein
MKPSTIERNIRTIDKLDEANSIEDAIKQGSIVNTVKSNESKELGLPPDNALAQALHKNGITYDYLAKKLMDLLEKKTIKINSKGEVTELDDSPIQLKAMELILKQVLANQTKMNNHLHLHGETVNELFNKT